jgi:hypothetical protein
MATLVLLTIIIMLMVLLLMATLDILAMLYVVDTAMGLWLMIVMIAA